MLDRAAHHRAVAGLSGRGGSGVRGTRCRRPPTLVLWLIYVSYLVLRRFVASAARCRCGGGVRHLRLRRSPPIVYTSIRWFRTQHPSPVMGGGENSGLAPAMLHVFLINLAVFTVLGFLFIWLRYKLQIAEQALESAHAQAALKGAA